MREIGYILFGWALGLLSTLFVGIVRDHVRKIRFQEGLCAELREAVPLLVGMHSLLKSRLGEADRDTLEWTHSMFSRFCPDDAKTIRSVEKLLKKPDGTLEKALTLSYEESKGKSEGMSKLGLPFLQQNLSFVSLLAPEIQRRLAQIQRDIRTVNSQIDAYDYWSKKTFDASLSPNNYLRVNSNVDYVSQAEVKLSYKIAESMSRVISDLGK